MYAVFIFSLSRTTESTDCSIGCLTKNAWSLRRLPHLRCIFRCRLIAGRRFVCRHKSWREMSPDYELWDGLRRRHQFSFVPRADLANELTLPLIVYPPLNHHKLQGNVLGSASINFRGMFLWPGAIRLCLHWRVLQTNHNQIAFHFVGRKKFSCFDAASEELSHKNY